MKNKINLFIAFIISLLLFGFGTAGLSLGKQDTWLNLYQNVYEKVLNTKERIVVDLNNEGRVDNFVTSPTREVLLKKYYSACTGSRLVIDDNIFLRVSNGNVARDYDLSLFETLPSPRDNRSYILQGNLECRYGSRDKYDGYDSTYSKLSNDNSLYIPSSLADIIKADFLISDDKDIIAEDNSECILNYEIINSTNTDDIINKKCNVSGIFEAESSLGKAINSFGTLKSDDISTAICSPSFLSSFPHASSRFIIFMIYNSSFKKNNETVKSFASTVQYAFKKNNISPKCISSISKETTLSLNAVFANYSNSPVLRFKYLFLGGGLSFYILLFSIAILKGKFSKNCSLFSLRRIYIITGMSISFLMAIGILKIVNIVLKSFISVLSIHGLFYSVILFSISLIIVIIAFWKKHKLHCFSLPKQIDSITYYSVDI